MCGVSLADPSARVGWFLRWWPLIAVGAMLALGIVVGKGSTALDDWFLHGRTGVYGHRHVLREFADGRVMSVLVVVAVLGALWRRRWWLAAVVATFPPATVLLVRVLKPLFGREKDDALAYPSGHTALMVVTLGMVLLVLGWRGWAVIAAAVVALLGILGLAMTYHYFTDTVGSVLLGTAIVCLAVRITGQRPPGSQFRGADRFD